MTILLKNGIVLSHGADDHVTALHNTDVLIEGNKIVKIGKSLASADETIDCTHKIISPGFVDTHHHMWQTQLKGRHADETLLQYMISGNMQSYSFTPKDIFWGQLGGCLEAIDAGTTTVVDHAHLTYSEEHAAQGLSATVSSGIRSFFCYCPISRLQKWDKTEMVPDFDFLPDWFMKQFEELAKAQPYGDGRVNIGLAFDFFFLPKEVIENIYAKARSMGIKLITSHYTVTAVLGMSSLPELLSNYGLLKSDVLLSHATGGSANDAKLLRDAGAFVSTTPETEGQMALGLPVAFGDFKDVASLGIDCHANGPSDIVGQMRLGLQLTRQNDNQTFLDKGKFPANLVGSTEEAFNLGTIKGARAVRMEHEIGSLAEGKLADITIFNSDSPSMTCAVDQDPLVAVVRHSSIRDIDIVIVNGVIRKYDGNLTPVTLEGGQNVFWKNVATELKRSRTEVQQRIDKLDMNVGLNGIMQMFHIDKSNIVDKIAITP